MSHGYKAVGWNRQKRLYDGVLAAGVATYLLLFCGGMLLTRDTATLETALIRDLGTCALLLLHVVLVVGPLARLDRRFLPLLYNRRHLGVTTFLLGLAHGTFALVQYHAGGNRPWLVSLLSANPRLGSFSQFPFELLGVLALLILFLMAATSHDFWLANLGAPVWKALHMAVYLAYALLIAHVALGVLQAETHPALAGALVAGASTVVGLHLLAGWRERAGDRPAEARLPSSSEADGGFLEVCRLGEIPEKRARIVTVGGERVAVFRYDGKVSAVSNVCRHQNGPLGEGRIVGGCITCPWHGYQYLPETGSSPPPFAEKVPTYRVRLEGDRVLVHPFAHPPGTRQEPACSDMATLATAPPASIES
ncbi:MAG TPA: ferric reductase-like transmembrane domain-containing protein [Thermoanaerobaculia bacterium]|nr:ferric reductase-like transmembrane domain-containing protein [Thermoanaerobaculia bacterium]